MTSMVWLIALVVMDGRGESLEQTIDRCQIETGTVVDENATRPLHRCVAAKGYVFTYATCSPVESSTDPNCYQSPLEIFLEAAAH
jgi:hypothetical protein